MSYCRICGDESGAEYRPSARQTLCTLCADDTPVKVGRSAFEAAYKTPAAIRREFYDDYLTSNYTLAEYIKHTTAYTEGF